MRTANYSELRANMKHYLDGVIHDNEPLIVYRQGAESVVVRPVGWARLLGHVGTLPLSWIQHKT